MSNHPLVSIVVATYNERENILQTIKEIFRCVTPPLEVIVVDDNSPDRTWEVVEQLNQPNVRLIRRVDERGLASAFYRGIQESKGEIVGWMDADRSMPPSLLPGMIEKLSEYDIVIASRYVPGGKDDRSLVRVLASWLINKFAQIVLTPKIRDFDSGFIVLNRSVLVDVPLIPTGYGEYFIEFLYAAAKREYRILEVPYIFKERQKGASKSVANPCHFFKTGLNYIFRIISARLRN